MKQRDACKMYRKATVNDCEKVYELICGMESKRLPYDEFAAIFKAQSDNERYYCLVCEDGGVIGALNLRFEAQLHHAGRRIHAHASSGDFIRLMVLVKYLSTTSLLRPSASKIWLP